MRKLQLEIILITALFLIIIGCTYSSKEKTSSLQEQPYKISSLIDFDSSLCGYIEGTFNDLPPNYGTKVIVKDKKTGKLLEDYSTGAHSTINIYDKEGYNCERGTGSDYALLSVHSSEYAPLDLVYKYPRNKLATVEVFMTRSCSGGPGYFDNLNRRFSAEIIGNQTLADQYLKESQDEVYFTINRLLGLVSSDYTLQCIEGERDRALSLNKVKGTYKDGSPFELNYIDSSGASSGGNSGWQLCFSSTSDSLFESMRNNQCNRIEERQAQDGVPNPETLSGCNGPYYDNTSVVRNKCLSGEFSKIEGNKKTLSIVQQSGRCKHSVSVGEFNCLEN